MTGVKRVPLGGSEASVPNVVLGLMRIADASDDEVRALVRAARDAGIDFFDHADIYGSGLHACERRFAEALRLTPAERAEITIQSKAGIVKDGPYYDFSYDHLVRSVEQMSRQQTTMMTQVEIEIERLKRVEGQN